MALKKCPKCELNYIRGDAEYCDVCLRQVRREASRTKQAVSTEEDIICSECGEAPAVPGFDLCTECLREQKRQKELENAMDLEEDFDEDDVDDEEV